MNKQYKNNHQSYIVDDDHAALLQASIHQEVQRYDETHQQQVNLFDPQYNTPQDDSYPHAPIDKSPHQHAPNHLVHEHSNPRSSQHYLRDPDTGLWVNQVRGG
jgi:hypothetical protein